jgi:hypothetical protein
MSRRTIAIALLAASVLSTSLEAQELLWERGGRTGGVACAAGDLDGDGHADWAMADRAGEDGTVPLVRIVSGRTGQSLRTYRGEPDSGYGTALASLADRDGDGIPELAIAAPFADRPVEDAGEVLVISPGRDVLLLTLRGTEERERLGAKLAAAGDVDGDGLEDLLVADYPAPDFTSIFLFRGADGLELSRYPTTLDGLWDPAMAGVGDLDDDGFDDVLLGVADSNGVDSWARVISGGTGEVMFEITGTSETRVGLAATGVGDWNADGTGDFALSSFDTENWTTVTVYSGADGGVIRELTADAAR